MKFRYLHLALLPLLLCSPAQGQEAEYGTGLICDTRQQAEQLVAHLNGDIAAAVSAVNIDAHDPKACGIATVAFVRGPDLGMARGKDATFKIVRILVFGLRTSSGFQPVAPAIYVSLFKIDEIAV